MKRRRFGDEDWLGDIWVLLIVTALVIIYRVFCC